MFRAVVLLCGFSVCAIAGSGPVREVTSQAERVGNRLSPAFYKGYIYWIGRDGRNGTVTIYAPDDHAPLTFDGNGPVHSIAIDTDGTVAVAWGRWDSEEGGGVDFRDKYGQLLKTIRTPEYVPVHLWFADDHSLWSFGGPRNAEGRSDPHGMTVRKYLPDGKEAGAYLPRSVFPPGLEPGGFPCWRHSITVAPDRVGLWAVSGQQSSQTEWVELGLDGKLLGRWRLDQFTSDANTQVALTADGHVFLQQHDTKTGAHPLYELDRTSSTWRAVEAPPSGRMEAADGEALIFSDFGLGPIHLRWYPQP